MVHRKLQRMRVSPNVQLRGADAHSMPSFLGFSTYWQLRHICRQAAKTRIFYVLPSQAHLSTGSKNQNGINSYCTVRVRDSKGCMSFCFMNPVYHIYLRETLLVHIWSVAGLSAAFLWLINFTSLLVERKGSRGTGGKGGGGCHLRIVVILLSK